jgi:hypothetical protein
MFTRNSTNEPKKLEPLKNNSGPSLNVPAQPQVQPPQRRQGPAEANAKSVIGNDLKIIGQGLKIISQGTLQRSSSARRARLQALSPPSG